MSAHTPGPWPIKGWSAGDSHGWQIRLGRHEDAQRLNIYNDSQSSECDARLIAAAPDLLEALEKTVNRLGDDCGTCGPTECSDCLDARAVIAKARGTR